MKVGFIGLGGMGRYMAANVLKAGHDLSVYDIRESAVRELEQLGASRGAGPRALGEACDIVLASLPSNEASRTVALSEDGVLNGASEGDVYVELSTITPHLAREIAEAAGRKGVHMLDAPVSGGVRQREEGTLTIMVGGESDALAKATPVLEAIGSRIFHVGESGAGCAVKLANNLIALTSMVTIMEGLTLGVKAGVDPEILRDVISVSSGGSPLFNGLSNAILQRAFEPPEGQVASQSLKIIPKDLQLALGLASDLRLPLPVTSAALQTWLAGRAKGLDDMEFPSLITLFEDIAQIEVRSRD